MAGEKISVELYREEGENSRSIFAIADSDAFKIDGGDYGPKVKEFWGFDSYEFWTIVPREAWGSLLVAFAQEYLSGDDGVSKLRDLCRKHGVTHSWDSWVSHS